MIRCRFCPATIPSVDAAIDAGWNPSFYAGDDEIAEPFCGHCAADKDLLPMLPEGDIDRDSFVLNPVLGPWFQGAATKDSLDIIKRIEERRCRTMLRTS